MMKKCILGLALSLCFVFNSFSETITIDKDKLETVIRTRVEQMIGKAIDEAVAIAIKDVESKYIVIVGEKDKKIAELFGDIKTRDVIIEDKDITIFNLKEEVRYERDSKILIAGITGVSSLIVGFLVGVIFF